ncbi:KH domain-containing protein HEN4 isoform X3 [Ricinus communis]|uniref:KH domain-containing protein HEN4 isoform X3 n=1 Tax=Ricinus communis TaxID=3988 RepID=UPI0007723C24|nr:KH domain-containing protein HEN4 isoform X3 [Ricinus communis]|eukprot:XP_015582836.1 KH domain-containing protein HEN4 isoform X3 [Ricinus communis]
MQHHRDRRRRPRPTRPPVMLQPGQVAFRVVCHASIIGGLIGRSGSAISQIRRDTGCTVHCDEQVQGSDHRVITIVGPASPGKRITLNSTTCHDHNGAEEEEKELVSVAQEAVIRVCERMWEVDGQRERRGGVDNNSNNSGLGEGYCGLLADTTQIGAVVGKGGKNVLRMRRESGADIRFLPPPHCASKDDQLIQITGSILAVKKALVAVTDCLHDCPPYEKDPTLLMRPLERASHLASSDPHAEFFPHLSSLLPPLSGNSGTSHPLSSDAGEDPNQDAEAVRHEVSFRLLCSNGAAGSIIGKKGTIVRTLQNETGASIMFAAPMSMSGERVVTISALENLESWHSPAQNAAILVFARSVEHDIEKGHPSGLIEGATVTARLLVASDAVCCLIEKGGTGNIDSEMIEVSGADIRILDGEQIMACASEDDVVIEITGEYKNVQNALFMVTGKLRGNLLPSEVLNEKKARSPQGRKVETASPRLHQPAGLSPDSDQETSLTRAMNQLGFSSSFNNASLPRLQSAQKFQREHTTAIKNQENSLQAFGGGSGLERSLHFLLPKEVLNEVGERSSSGGVRQTTSSGSHSSSGLAPGPIQDTSLTRGINQPQLSNNIDFPSPALHMPQQTAGRGKTFGRGAELESRKRSPIVVNTIIELVVPEDTIGSVYGEDGSNLARLRQISGAKVEVREPSSGKSGRIVVISGTPDQTNAAQSLLQAFILADQ